MGVGFSGCDSATDSGAPVDVGGPLRSWSSTLASAVGVDVERGVLVGRGVRLGIGVGSGTGLEVGASVGVTSGLDCETGAVVTCDCADSFSDAAAPSRISSCCSSEASMERWTFGTSEPSWLSTGCLGTAASSDNNTDAGSSGGALGVTAHAANTMTAGSTNMTIGENLINLSNSQGSPCKLLRK